MNFLKAQKIVFDGLCKGLKQGRFDIDESHVFVSPDGYRGFIFPTVAVNFNLEKIKEIPSLSIKEIVKPEHEMSLTADMRIDDRHRKLYRRLKGLKKSTFVNESFLDCFQNPKFFQAEDRNSIIVVTENEVNEPVGVVLPINATWYECGYYADDLKGGALND